MPLPGGSAAKFGQLFEGLWTVHYMLDVMANDAQSIFLEPPGIEGDGIEFYVKRGDGKTYIQAKRQTSESGAWSIANLAEKKVIQSLVSRSGEPGAKFIFASTQSSILSELCDRAQRAKSFDDFKANFLDSENWQKQFSEFTARSQTSPEQAFQALKVFQIEVVGEPTLKKHLAVRGKSLVEGDSNSLVDVLAQFALEKANHELSAADIWDHIQSRQGFKRIDLSKDESAIQRVREANAKYKRSLDAANILGTQISRHEEIARILPLLKPQVQKKNGFIVGEAGAGKSAVLSQFVDTLETNKTSYLAFRIDRVNPVASTNELGQQILGLRSDRSWLIDDNLKQLFAFTRKRPNCI
ncbi:MAG: hypothetical protein AB7K68_12730 [Bacteriovoracia bacterium]